MKIFARLESLEAKARSMENELSDPGASKDLARFQKTAKELAELRPIVEMFKQYKKNEKEKSDLQHAAAEKGLDAEMEKLYKEELQTLQKRQDELVRQMEDKLFVSN